MDKPTDIVEAPKALVTKPWLALGIGFLFLVIVLIIEAFKPGAITGPIRTLLRKLGLKGA